jgi:hypothetical protein
MERSAEGDNSESEEQFLFIYLEIVADALDCDVWKRNYRITLKLPVLRKSLRSTERRVKY